MRRRILLQWACLWAVSVLVPAGWAQECSDPVQVPDKPELSQFSDYNTFLVEVMKYKSTKRERQRHQQLCPALYEEKERPSRNPTVIEGPETLSEALQRADKIPRLNYSRHQTWHNRTTSRSFPLPDMERNQLSDSMLESNLRLMRGYEEPRSGQEWLPPIFNKSLNLSLVTGQEAQALEWRFFEQWLPEQEARFRASTDNVNFGDRLAFISPIQGVGRNTMQVFVGQDGDSIRNVGSVYVTSCLSSCTSPD